MLNLIYKEIEEDPSKLSKYASLETINFLKNIYKKMYLQNLVRLMN